MKAACAEALREIERFLDGESVDPAKTRIEEHLSACRPCHERAEFKRHVKILIAEKCSCDEMPTGMIQRVMGLLDQDPGSDRSTVD